MKIYHTNLTHDEIKNSFKEFFENRKNGKIVKIRYLLEHYPESTRNMIREVFGNCPDYVDDEEFIYNCYYPACNKTCDVCGKPLDGFSLRKGYYKGLSHKQCTKPYSVIKFQSYSDLINNQIIKTKTSIKHLSERFDVLELIKQLKLDHPQLSYYKDIDCIYLLVMSNCMDDVLNFPTCSCGNPCKVRPDYNIESKTFTTFCYNDSCRHKVMISKCTDKCKTLYGVDNISQSQLIKEKKAKTCLSHYGDWKNFTNQTVGKWCEQQGIKNVSQLQSVKDKKAEKILSTYKDWKTFVKATLGEWCKRNGVENTSQLDSVKIAKDMNYLDKTNGMYRNPFQDPEIISSIVQYWKDHPEENVLKYKKVGEALKLSKSKIDHYRKGYTGVVEFDVLNELQKMTQYKILRQTSCMQYFIDGYIKEYNLAIEYDEFEVHLSQEAKSKDLIREKEIVDYTSCKFFRISEIEWLYDKNQVFERFKQLLESIELHTENNINLELLPNGCYRIRKNLA